MVVVTSLFNLVISSFPDNMFYHVWTTLLIYHDGFNNVVQMNSLFQHAWTRLSTTLFKLASSTMFKLASSIMFKLANSTMFKLASLTMFKLTSSTMFKPVKRQKQAVRFCVCRQESNLHSAPGEMFIGAWLKISVCKKMLMFILFGQAHADFTVLLWLQVSGYFNYEI